MKDNELITDIEHIDVPNTVVEDVTYNFDRSIILFAGVMKTAYTNQEGIFFEKSCCKALINVSEAIHNYPKSIMIFNNKEAILNVMEIVENNPAIINTLSSEQLMDMFAKYMSREDLTKPNGEFNPISIFNCAKEDFGIDLLSKIKIPFFSSEQILNYITEKM